MSSDHLHIVSFNVPWPADYGGVIDVYYRIVALAKAGIHIHLHCYAYGRTPAKELEQWCDEVCYYPRETGLRHQLEYRPYIVASRCSKALLQRLRQDDYPILLEGLHCCLTLEQLAGEGRPIYVRSHNVEHDYYRSLAQAERKIWKRIFYLVEAKKLQRYEPVLRSATKVLAISSADTAHFSAIGCKNVVLLPPSHGHTEVISAIGKGDYILYHGNLSVGENIRAALFILEHIASRCPYQFVFAGKDPDPSLQAAVSTRSNVRLVSNPDEAAMHRLVEQAHIHLLITDQATGVKLKLMNALYEGRYCVANSTMVQGTPLGDACTIADTPDTLCAAIDQLMVKDFTEAELLQRRDILNKVDPTQNISSLIFQETHLTC